MPMALPLAPLLIGAAAGAVITYVLMTKNSRTRIRNAAHDLTDSAESGADKVTDTVSGAMDDATQMLKKARSRITK
jgi:hypothetical protein